MAYQTLNIDFPEKTIAVVSLTRLEAANALNTQMALELKDFFASAARACRVVIITGSGKHFCAGADLKERHGMSKKAWQAQHKAFRRALSAIMACPIPVIAAVNGAAFGGGLELALACDFIYAAREAKFALTEVTLGILPGMGGTQTLPRAAGFRRAKELMFTGKAFSAQEAVEWRIVNKLCSAENLLAEALDCAKMIASNAPLSVKAAKQAITHGISMKLPQALALELKHYNSLLDSRDRVEGIAAFNEKRKARFTGE